MWNAERSEDPKTYKDLCHLAEDGTPEPCIRRTGTQKERETHQRGVREESHREGWDRPRCSTGEEGGGGQRGRRTEGRVSCRSGLGTLGPESCREGYRSPNGAGEVHWGFVERLDEWRPDMDSETRTADSTYDLLKEGRRNGRG